MAHSRRDPESSPEHELATEDELFQDDSPSLLVETDEREPPRVSRVDERLRPRAVVRPGDVLAGKYRVERMHAPGVLGVTCDAQHERLGQRVAVKLFSAEAGVDTERRARFLHSSRLAAQLRSEHLARVLDLGALHSGAPYCVVEHLSGTDLRPSAAPPAASSELSRVAEQTAAPAPQSLFDQPN
jgi:serine/threonine protein kinase